MTSFGFFPCHLQQQQYPKSAQSRSNHEEEVNHSTWGFADTKYKINDGGNLEITGSRYSSSGQVLPHFIPWANSVFGVDIPLGKPWLSQYPPAIMKPIVNRALLKTIEEIFHSGQLSWDAQQRLRHGHGHTQEEVYSINFGVGIGRVPDLVVFPESVRQVERLIESAVTCDVCLIPYGGGTNVSQALRCPEVESRMIVSVDISRMDKIRWVDPENRLACIEAGAVGRHIEAALGHHGLCLGHEPDSMEFSTLGGWIATKASGMKRNQYGNIEDITLDVEAVSASGVLAFTPNIAPRQSVGSDPKTFIFGSEGNTCIITAAVVKLRPLPAVRYYGSFVFPCFESGIQFMKEMSQESVQPASIRLVDNMQLRFSQALKPTPTLWASLKSRFEAKYLGLVKGFNLHEMAACTLVFEGKKMDVQRQQQIVHKKAKKFHGLEAGAENGRRGYEMTFAIAYIRDCVMSLGVFAESFETSCTWSNALGLYENVKARIIKEHQSRRLPGNPFITCRISQIYPSGVTLYFYVALYLDEVEDPVSIYTKIEEAAREEILRCGGSLSHHHGIGKLRKKFLHKAVPSNILALNLQFKQAMDAGNVFGCGN